MMKGPVHLNIVVKMFVTIHNQGLANNGNDGIKEIKLKTTKH